MLLIIFTSILCIIIGVFFWVFSCPVPEKILGVYTQPGRTYPFKVLFFYALVWIRRNFGSERGTAGYGVKSKPKDEEMEGPQKLSEHPKAIDAVYFNAADENGNYVVMATARRPKGVINGFLYIRIPEIGIMETPKLPDTLLFGEEGSFKAEGLEIQCVTPMKAWRLKYKGPMKLHGNNKKVHEVDFNMLWTAKSRYFDFDTDMNTWALSRSIAREEWSREYFNNLKEAHQTHYEQMGRMEGLVDVDGKTYDLTSLDSMRDHSYGYKREWKLIHRYCLHMFHTEEGLSGNVGIVSQPITASQLELGYISNRNNAVVPVSTVSLPLWQHGENGSPPKDYAFSFMAGGEKYVVEVKVVESPEFFIGWEWETRVVERMATFKVNGVRGWGLAEWDYRFHQGRPEEYAQKDPKWTNGLNKG